MAPSGRRAPHRGPSRASPALIARQISPVASYKHTHQSCQASATASSLTDSLRSVVRLRRAVSAHSKAVIRLSTESGDNAGKNMYLCPRLALLLLPLQISEQKASKRPGTVKRPRCWRFSIGSAPLTSITKIDAQVRGGETRQDYKDTRRFPLEAPSCALLFRPCRLPDTCPPFSLREAWRFLIAHAVGISVRCRSFAPSWAVCTNPPFSPTAAPYPVTIVLSPTR